MSGLSMGVEHLGLEVIVWGVRRDETVWIELVKTDIRSTNSLLSIVLISIHPGLTHLPSNVIQQSDLSSWPLHLERRSIVRIVGSVSTCESGTCPTPHSPYAPITRHATSSPRRRSPTWLPTLLSLYLRMSCDKITATGRNADFCLARCPCLALGSLHVLLDPS